MRPVDLSEHVVINRDAWTQKNAKHLDAGSRRMWARAEVTWGLWGVPERELQALPDLAGKDVIELGCGVGYFGARLKRAGARRVVGVDITPAQLDSARRCEAEFGLGLEFIEANAEDVPLGGGQFDLAVSEYGASIWCVPNLWIAEAARLLRPGGELVFLRNSTLSMLCMPDTGKLATTLQRPLSDLRRLEWKDDDPGVEFHPSTGEMLRLLRRTGFEVIDLIEVMAPDEAVDSDVYVHFSADWSKQWPSEEIWRARRS
jgi:SAM-dependent methyltransferase